MSLYTSSSNFRFLSQGVAAAIQKRHLSDPACALGRDEAVGGIPTALKAATAPKPSRNILRVVFMVFLLSLLPAVPATEVYDKPLAKRKAKGNRSRLGHEFGAVEAP
jgi:hypothetical protein